MTEYANIPWIEKYRPTKFEDIVFDEMNEILFKKILENDCFPNLLFYGPPGTGKTTTIINLIEQYLKKKNILNKSSVIHLNASDDRGIDIIRNQINQFVKSLNLFNDGYKFVILDEVDYMTKNAQQALKYLLQTSTHNVRFCLICNYISKIDETLQNEFITIRFNQLPSENIHIFLKNISKNENLNLNDEIIHTIQNIYGSDIRGMINFLQLNQNETEWKNKIVNKSIWKKIHQLLTNETKKEDILSFIHLISVQYNIEKKYIILKYFNYVISHHSSSVNNKYIELIEKIIHSTDDISSEHVMKYFIINVCNFYNEHKIEET